MLQQRTLQSLTKAVGVGLHSGQRVELTLRPEWVGKRLVVGLKGGLSNEIEDWMDTALIGPAHVFSELREKRVLGYRRARISAAPEMQLHGIPGVILSQLEIHTKASAQCALTMYSTESAMMSRLGNEYNIPS